MKKESLENLNEDKRMGKMFDKLTDFGILKWIWENRLFVIQSMVFVAMVILIILIFTR